MEDISVTLKALVLLVAVLAILIGTLVTAPQFTVLIVTLLAWANLAWLFRLTLYR